MRFLVDECSGPALAAWLRGEGHDVFSVYDQARGMTDDDVIRKAAEEGWVLITNDRHFGEKVYREHHRHKGVILMRLEHERAANKIDVLRRLLAQHGESLHGRFVVVTDTSVRFGPSTQK